MPHAGSMSSNSAIIWVVGRCVSLSSWRDERKATARNQTSNREQAVIAKTTQEVTFSSVKIASLDSCHYRVSDVFVHGVQHDVPQFLKIVRIFVVCSSLMLLIQWLSTQHCSKNRCSCIVKVVMRKLWWCRTTWLTFIPLTFTIMGVSTKWSPIMQYFNYDTWSMTVSPLFVSNLWHAG